jgi:hypothetical protein
MSSEQKVVKRTYIKVPEFKADHMKVRIEAQHAKNFKSAILFIRFETENAKPETVAVLNAMIRQYARIHDMGVGISAKNNIMKVIPGETSIYIMTDEHHIVSNIKLFYKYIIEKKLDGRSPAIKAVTSYETIKPSISTMNVIVYGKCQGFIKKFPANGKDDGKINPIKSLEAGLVVNKTASGIIPVNAIECPTLSINTQEPHVRLMVAIILAEIPFIFRASNIQFNTVSDMERAKELLHDRKLNIIVLKRFVEQLKPEFEKDKPSEAFVNRFRIIARVMFNLKGSNNDCTGDLIKLFVESCKGRTNTAITNLAKIK